MIVASVPGLRGYSSLAIASRIGNPQDFPRPSSLSNFFGLTPGCCNSGDLQRPGSITKEGSSLVRGLLSNCIYHVLRKDAWMREWYKRIKRRRGSGIARVAVMRRLVTIIWKMLREQMPYVPGGPAEVEKQRRIIQGTGALHRLTGFAGRGNESPSPGPPYPLLCSAEGANQTFKSCIGLHSGEEPSCCEVSPITRIDTLRRANR